MRSRRMWLLLILSMPLFLAACMGTFEIQIEDGRPTPAGLGAQLEETEQVAVVTPPTATVGLTAPPQATVEIPRPTATLPPTAAPTELPSPMPTRTPKPTSSPTIQASSGPEINAFQVVPAQAEPGDTVALIWEAQGDRATICPTSRYVLFTKDDCLQVPVSGATTYTLPLETAGFQTIGFILQVETTTPAATATAQTSVALKCERTWFFSDVPQAGICPREPILSYAAAQFFERGTMIWMEEPGRYYILEDAPLPEGTDRYNVDVVNDPLQIKRDTSQEIDPPSGFYAPVSGFGLVWRGDVEGSPGYHQRLGWALEPEFGYEAILQCDDARPSGGRSWQTCYLNGPDGEVIVLHPLGGWTLLGDG